jgi:DNA-binding transcriptional ArsR family regulator
VPPRPSAARPSAARPSAAATGRPASAAEAAAAQADPQAAAAQADPQATGGQSGTPAAGGQSDTPAARAQSGTPAAGAQSGTPATGGQSGTPATGAQSGTPVTGARAGRPAATTSADPQASAAQDGPQAGGGAAGAAAGRDTAAIGGFIERFAGILYGAGMPRMPARVFAALLAADASQLSAADLAAVLGVSPAAVSGAVRYLGQVGLVATAGEPGSRRLSYSVPDEVWAQLMETRNSLLARMRATLLDGAALLGAGTPAGDRLTRSARYFEFVLDELALVHDRWRELGASPGPIGSAEGDTGPDGTGRDGARAGGPA